MSTSSTITPDQLQEIMGSNRDLDLIDVRTPAEFQELHVKSARNVPLDKLDPNAIVKERNGSAEEPVADRAAGEKWRVRNSKRLDSPML